MVEEKEIKKSVLHKKHGGGPHGVGDPDDKSLRRVEKDVLIPKKMRDIARKEKCIPQVEAFNACCRENSFYMVVACQEVNSKMRDCLAKWYHDTEFRKKCTEEYLQERTEFRRTGIHQKTKRLSY